MRKLLIASSVLVLLIAGAAGALLLVPLDSFRAPLEQAISRGLGRDIHIAGPMHISFYPEIGLSAADVSIDNVPGGQAKEFAHVGTLAVGAKLMPLFAREIDITRLSLENPSINLEVDSGGNGNWNFRTGSSSSSSSAPSRLSISGLKISNGEISYFDARTGKHSVLSQANAGLSLAALDQPATFDLDAVYDNDKYAVTGRVDSPDSYLGKQPTKVLLDLTSSTLNLHFDGTVTGATQSSGVVKLSGPSLRALIKGAGAAAPGVTGLGAFSLEGGISSQDRVYSLKDAKLALDDIKASVDLAVDMKGTVPAIKGTIALDRLDAGSYMTGKSQAGGTSGWSTEPLSLAGLKLADADVDISADTLSVGTFTVSRGKMNVALHGGALTADLTQAALFSGSVTGRVTADASGATPKFGVKLAINNVAMKALLQSALKVDRIEGTGILAVDVTGSGASQQAIMNSLAGTSSVTVKNGAIRGVDLAAVSRSIQNILSGALSTATSSQASTDFAEAGGTFKISNGVMHNDDFHLLDPFIRVTGSGDINLGPRTLQFEVVPKLVSSQQGQGGAANAAGLAVPFQISGPWTKPNYKPDLKALGSSLVNQMQNGGLSGLLGDLGGKKPAAGASSIPSQGLSLKSLFGGH
jgi:AsmA protein